jgi:GNAT superfamily N-acetyltransferase
MTRVIEIKSSHSEFVSDVIKKRWNVSKERALRFVDEYLSGINNSKCFVAECNHIPVGMGTFHINNDVDIDLHPWCIGLWVNPQYRGNGIGHRLTLKRFAWARKLGYKKIYLDTVSAEGYHEKFGWKNTGLIGWYDNTPTIIMEHNL